MARQSRPYWHPVKKRWRVRIQGVETWAPHTLGKNDEAKAWAWLRGLIGGEVSRPTDRIVTFRQVANHYLAWLEEEVEADKRSRIAYIGDRTHLRKFAAFGSIGSTNVAGLNVGHLEAFVRSLNCSDNYKRNIVKSIQASLNWAARPMANRPPLIDANPLRGVKKPPVRQVDRYRPSDDIRRFMRRCWAYCRALDRRKSRDGRIAIVLLQFIRLSGCRPGEGCKLRWEDVLWSDHVIRIDSTRHKTGTRTGKYRTIYLTDRILRVLKLLANTPRDDGYVFGHMRGPWNSVALAAKIRRWRHALGTDINAYTLRHGYCTEALSAGVSYSDLAKLVGNSPSTLERYYDHPVHERLIDKAAEIDRKRRSG